MIRNCQCGHRNHRSGVGADVPVGCRVSGCRCREANPVACSLVGWTQRWECDWCGQRLPRGHRRWCGPECELAWGTQHIWALARPAALARDGYACIVCRSTVALEINHVVPRRGAGYLAGCAHHSANLETLCHDHHVAVTNAQRAGLSGNARDLLTPTTSLAAVRGAS